MLHLKGSCEYTEQWLSVDVGQEEDNLLSQKWNMTWVFHGLHI
jgi:hypothetical protein